MVSAKKPLCTHSVWKKGQDDIFTICNTTQRVVLAGIRCGGSINLPYCMISFENCFFIIILHCRSSNDLFQVENKSSLPAVKY